jgi:hypothetical protein
MSFLDHVVESNGIHPTEASYFMAGYGANDPDAEQHRLEGYRKPTQKQNERDLMPLEQARMIDIAHWLYDANPVAKRIIDLINAFVAFVAGDGFT